MGQYWTLKRTMLAMQGGFLLAAFTIDPWWHQYGWEIIVSRFMVSSLMLWLTYPLIRGVQWLVRQARNLGEMSI